MFNRLASLWFRWIGGEPCFRIHGKSRREATWRVIDVYATSRRDADSRWPRPFWQGTCIAWSAHVIAIGCDVAECILREQSQHPASREFPVEVIGGRLSDVARRTSAGGSSWPSTSEVLAHECGHTAQALRWSWLYWPIGATFTLFREGSGWWHEFENEASEQGLFGGIVNGSVRPDLLNRLRSE